MSLAALGGGCDAGPRPASWDYISPTIFQPNCASSSCHSRATAVSGLDFSDADRGYKSLTQLWVWIVNPTRDGGACGVVAGTTVCEEQFRPLVVPYSPDESRVVNTLRGRNAPRMPPDRPLSESDIRLVEQWILDGALRHEGQSSGAMDGGGDGAPLVDGGDGALVKDSGGAADAAGDARD